MSSRYRTPRYVLAMCALLLPLHAGTLVAQQGDPSAPAPAPAPSANGGGRLVGRVQDVLTSAPVAQARIEIRPGSCRRGTRERFDGSSDFLFRSDSTGQFDIALPAGKYSVAFWAIGYGDPCYEIAMAGGEEVALIARLGPPGYDEVEREEMLRTLRAKWARWREQRPRAYRFRYRQECFCFGVPTDWVVVEVRGDQFRVLDPESREELGQWLGTTVDELFSLLEREIRNPQRRIDRIEYDRKWGYPKRIETDSAYDLTDMWQRIRVADLRPIR